MCKRKLASLFAVGFLAIAWLELEAQNNSHPHLYFDGAGMAALQQRALSNPRLNKIWLQFKTERADSALRVVVEDQGFQSVTLGRSYGDALGDLTVAYIVLRDRKYVDKAIEIITDLARRPDWGGNRLIKAHISMGLAFCWDVMYDQFTAGERSMILDAILANANNRLFSNVYANSNWTSSAGEGLVGLAFQGDGNASFNSFVQTLLNGAKQNYKEKARSVLWAHGTDGFPHEGLGYWRKYNHFGLFLKALRRKEPQNDWFHLGKNYPGSEFLKNTAFPRIYAEVQHQDIAALTWSDAPQVHGKYGNIGVLALIASEYQDGYALDFLDYLVNQSGFRFNGEDWAAFVFYDDSNIPSKSYRDLPLSRYWPDMEAAIFRSGWDAADLVFYMKCGSPGGHATRIKSLPRNVHDHLDANGFVLFYNNDYLAAEDGYRPNIGPDAGTNKKFTSGHNTFLIDGTGQKGDLSRKAAITSSNMDYMDTQHMGYLLGDATDAYSGMDKFYRYVLYKKHKYVVILDELEDTFSHKYEFLLGTDDKHVIDSFGNNKFHVNPTNGSAKLLVDFVEPQQMKSSIQQDRIYTITRSYVDMLHVWPTNNAKKAAFLSLHYPFVKSAPEPSYSKIFDGGRSGMVVDGDEYFLYNGVGASYTFNNVSTDARLTYYQDDNANFEYLVAGCKAFLYQGSKGINSDKLLVAAFKGSSGKIRLGKTLGEPGEATITLFYPGVTGVKVDGQNKALVGHGPGNVSFKLTPKQHTIGPIGYEQTVTDNYNIEILSDAVTPFVQVVSPNGSESWQVGSSHSIQWTSDASFSTVKIEYSTDNGASWQVISNTTANDGQFNWTIPSTPSATALARISDAADGVPGDVSDNVFSIVNTPPPPPQPPIISSFVPTSGPVGTEVTISGNRFTGATEVKFNGVAALFSVLSDNQILATVPTGASTGKITATNSSGTGVSTADFVVTTGSGQLTILPKEDTFVHSSKPGKSGGSAQTLRVWKTSSSERRAYFKFTVSGVGTGFQSAKLRLLVFDGSANGGGIFAVSNFYEGTTTPWDESGLKWKNAPQISGPSLSFLDAVVALTWVEFDVSAAIFGDGDYSFALATSSSDQVKYFSKESSNPPQLVIVTNSGGPPPPTITSFSPTSGAVGTQVTISGQNLASTTAVSFGAVPATVFSVETDIEILATVPDGATTGKISVTTQVGTALSTSDFTVTPPPASAPVISSFTPTSGPIGTSVTLSGTNFSGTTAVRFNGVVATFSLVSDNTILTTVPTGATTGRIAVISASGTGISDADFVVTPSSGFQTLTFIPTDDAFVWDKKPTNSYGDAIELRVRRTSREQITYFRFSVTGLSGSVVNVKLRLLCTDGSNDGGSIYQVSNNFGDGSGAWTEGGLTWLNAPKVSGIALSSVGSVTASQIVEFDLAGAISTNGIYSFAVKNGSSDVSKYSSKEGLQVPELEITTTSATTAKFSSNFREDSEPAFHDLQTLANPFLAPNYPNPFNLETSLQYGLPQATYVRLVVYNIQGQRVRTLVDEYQTAGFKTVSWNGRDNLAREVSSGTYVIRLQAGQTVLTRKLILQK